MYTTPFRPSDLYHKICFCLVWTTCCTDIAVMLNLGFAALFLLFFSIIMVKNCLSVNDLNFWCACMCERERDREREQLGVLRPVNQCGYIRVCVCVCVCERERERGGGGVDEQNKKKTQYLKDMAFFSFLYILVSWHQCLHTSTRTCPHTNNVLFEVKSKHSISHICCLLASISTHTHTHTHIYSHTHKSQCIMNHYSPWQTQIESPHQCTFLGCPEFFRTRTRHQQHRTSVTPCFVLAPHQTRSHWPCLLHSSHAALTPCSE